MQSAVETYLFSTFDWAFLYFTGVRFVLLVVLNCLHDAVHGSYYQDGEHYYQKIQFREYAIPIIVKHSLHSTNNGLYRCYNRRSEKISNRQ